MISVRKLSGLDRDLRLRKIARLCLSWSRVSDPADLLFYRNYIREVLALLPAELVQGWVPDFSAAGLSGVRRGFWMIACRIEALKGREAADWDFEPDRVLAAGGGAGAGLLSRCAVYLEDLRSPFNVGSVFRTAAAYGFGAVYWSEATPGPTHDRVRRSAMGATGLVRCCCSELNAAVEDFGSDGSDGEVVLFALETGGIALDEFDFPLRGIAVLGSEEFGVHPATLQRLGARRVSIPLYGAKASLNVGVAFGILAQAWVRALGVRRESQS